MEKLIVANWKMNLNAEQARDLAADLQSAALRLETLKNCIILCPPFPYLGLVGGRLVGSSLLLGAQDCSAYEKGAYTGEVSASMLADVGCDYVIIGHSERRMYHQESSEIGLKKIEQAIKGGLIPIYCFGETKNQRLEQKTHRVIAEQLEILEALNERGGIIFAYEPVWAIGTGVTASSEHIQETHGFIKSLLSQKGFADSPLLYGGSVTADNARSILSIQGVDGVLVGGASLKFSEFWRICQD